MNTSSDITLDVILTAGPNGISSVGVTIDYSDGVAAGAIGLVEWSCLDSASFFCDMGVADFELSIKILAFLLDNWHSQGRTPMAALVVGRTEKERLS